MAHRPRPVDFDCPNCGAAVRAGALACPSCGADDETGWSDEVDEIFYEDVGGWDEPERRGSADASTQRMLVWTLVAVFVAIVVLVLR